MRDPLRLPILRRQASFVELQPRVRDVLLDLVLESVAGVRHPVRSPQSFGGLLLHGDTVRSPYALVNLSGFQRPFS